MTNKSFIHQIVMSFNTLWLQEHVRLLSYLRPRYLCFAVGSNRNLDLGFSEFSTYTFLLDAEHTSFRFRQVLLKSLHLNPAFELGSCTVGRPGCWYTSMRSKTNGNRWNYFRHSSEAGKSGRKQMLHYCYTVRSNCAKAFNYILLRKFAQQTIQRLVIKSIFLCVWT